MPLEVFIEIFPKVCGSGIILCLAKRTSMKGLYKIFPIPLFLPTLFIVDGFRHEKCRNPIGQFHLTSLFNSTLFLGTRNIESQLVSPN